MKAFFKIALFSAFVIFVSGCEFKLAPLYDASMVPIPVKMQEAPLSEIAEIINKAGIRRGWAMEDDGIGKITATLNERGHKAVADILYSQTNYSIIYDSSVNLNYNGTKIHRNYNRWVKNLEKDINKGLNIAALSK
ncbi:MAG: hypothetical protein COB93_08015 [Sneathiella sp.]|nr:MAG: hypothetical protein COB93_08015 [Sneathiella sp.]